MSATPIEKALQAQAERNLNRELLAFLSDLCHPEAFGYAVTAEVRKRARDLATRLEQYERVP